MFGFRRNSAAPAAVPNGSDIMAHISNSSNYRPIKEKTYNAYMCMPPVGTVIANKYEQLEGCRFLDGKQYLSAKSLAQSQISRPQSYQTIWQYAQQGLVDMVVDGSVVICGPTGAFEVKKLDEVAKMFEWSDGGKIDMPSIERRMRGKNLSWTPVKGLKASFMSNMLINAVTLGGFKACFIPAQFTNLQIPSYNGGYPILVNTQGCNHGKGDFLMAIAAGGQVHPISAINGEEFPYYFNIKGWQDCVADTNINFGIRDLPELF